jgi:multidrug efflux pump subunit AcrB
MDSVDHDAELERIPGVSDVEVRGGIVRQINVNCDPQKLQARGLSLQEVQEALRVNNQLIPSGSLQNPRVEYQLQIPTLFEDVSEIEQVVVATRRGINIKVRDVADVEDGTAPMTDIYQVNGKRGVGLLVLMQPRANVVKLSDDVRSALPDLAGVPEGAEVKVTFDQSNYVRTAIRSLIHEGAGGALLVSLVVLAFLRNLKSVLIICISIPLSVAAALVMLYLGDQTLNVFTLGGLTLALGRLVDDAIVVRENITRHLDEDEPAQAEEPTPGSPDRERRNRKSREVWEAVLRGTEEVGMPVLASTLTTIAVFVPVVFLQGISQKLFVPLATTIIFSMVASYLVSRTVDPVLATGR